MVLCFCNNKVIESFGPFNKRNNAECPTCKSLERQRFVMFFLKQTNYNFERTLHIAPEQQLVKLFKSISKNYVCGDINPSKYRIDNIIQLDVTNIPFKNVFNLVFASHILEHIIDDRKAIKQIYDALAVNGKFITLVPQQLKLKKTYEDYSIVTEEDRLKHFGQKDHVRWYGLDFSERLKDVGFYVKVHYIESIEQDINNIVCDEKNQLANNKDSKDFGFLDNDIIYECTKK
jgi:predicted SAM-dependent methyltransferase